MEFRELFLNNTEEITKMSSLAKSIVKEHYDPIIGPEQNDYMIDMFQSEKGIRQQLERGDRYFFLNDDIQDIGFIAIYPRGDAMYLNKFYILKEERGKGYASSVIAFISEEAKKLGLFAIELNVNKYNDSRFIYEKLGFKNIRSEKNDIGSGFYMDDFVYRLAI